MTHSSRIAAAILGFCLGTPGLAAALETLNYSGKLEEATRSPSGVFDPVVEWIWTRSASSPWPNHLNVMTTPGVIDLNGDDVPDLVFGATDSNAGSSLLVGVLCALDGADGSELFTVGSPMISTTMSVAVGDIDLDGLPEIVTCDASGTRMMAFEHDGIVQWISPNAIANTKWGAPSIADLDGDGVPEIVIGRSVFDNLGNLQWTGVGGSGEQGAGPLSLIADLDLDGTSEVVAGNTAYLSDGSFLWVNSSVSDGYNAVGNFDDDDFAEVVLVSSGTVILLEGETGSIKWGPMAIPGGGVGGPPTVADFDGDGVAEIGVSGATGYGVFETDGTLKWSRVIQDAGSSRTGSSAFDFEGDGSAEVVFSDEQNLEIYDGSTGDLLFSFALSSCTFHEYPLVADVDADGNAELVAVANSNCGIGPQQGIYVFGSASENWPASRGLWNQHTYHVTNINDDGSIPAAESINWLQPDLNSYRSQVVTSIVSVPPSVELTRPLEVRGANPVQGRDVVFEVSGREVGVVVFDAAGRAVRVLAGGAEVRWDLRDAAGRDVPAGIYYARRTDRSETVRVTVVR